MIVKNFCKLTHIMARLRASSNAKDYCHKAPFRRTAGTGHSLCIARTQQSQFPPRTTLAFTAAAAFTWNLFGSSGSDKEETPEDKLVNQIKRSILCIQREQFDKAEQMLHLALRMAQDMQSKDGITYVYDVMANLAMEREQFKKAEKIFTDVMKRLFADGHTEDSTKILHISSKIAHMAQMQGDLDKSHQGFTWTLQRLSKLLEQLPHDKDIQELYGLTKNWY